MPLSILFFECLLQDNHNFRTASDLHKMCEENSLHIFHAQFPLLLWCTTLLTVNEPVLIQHC